MQKIVTVFLVVLISSAGCTGQTNLPRDATPTEEPTTSVSIPLNDITYPPGTARSGITDRDTLLTAHQNALSRTDYKMSAYTSYLVTFSDGDEKRFRDRYDAESDQSAERAVLNISRSGIVGNGRNATYVIYSTDGTHYQLINHYYSRHYNTTPFQTTFDQYHSSMMYFNHTLNRTLANASLTAVEAFSDGDDRFVRFRISYPERDVTPGSILVREDGLIKQIQAPDGEREHYRLGSEKINDGFDRLKLETQSDIEVRSISWKDKAVRREYEQLRDSPSIDISDGSSACNNDGDQSHHEDNDLDNDGQCDED